MIDWREEQDHDVAGRPAILWRDEPRVPALYRVLGIEPGASMLEVRQVYRRLARAFHPDLQAEPDRRAAEQRMAECNAAYEILGDAERRRRYDAEHGLASLA
jgi:curved DNA-binding protein CbpA